MTQEYIREILLYDKDTGIFTWKKNTGYKKNIGKIAGSNRLGYIRIGINNKEYSAHRLAWLYVYGNFPKGQIDNINHDTSDNRICNIRDVSNHENRKNMSIGKNNTSGITGVSIRKSTGRWRATISHNRKSIHLGYFSTKEEAIKVRKEAEIKYGFHENHGVNLK